MSHRHEQLSPDASRRGENKRALLISLALATTFLAVELVAGLITNSLALLSDAGHMLSDSLSLAIALGAVRLAERPATAGKSFGYRRAEILAALANGVTLVAVAVFIFVEGIGRLSDPPDVPGVPLMVVAAAGLVVNVAMAAVLARGRAESLNLSAAFRHVLGDLAGSLGVLVAGAVILLTGFEAADAIVSLLIGLLVLGSSWGILRDATLVLLEATPRGIDAEAVGRAMAASPGVVEVHDLHVWEITSGFPALSAHVLVGADDDCHFRRREVERMLEERFGIEHTTLQVDHADRPELLEIEGLPQA